jgi:hypothetical protein
MKKISFPLLLVSLFFLLGCAKNSDEAVQVINVTNARFATAAIVPNLGTSYTSLACTTTDSMPGTKCVDEKGTSCKALTICTKVTADIRSGLYTRQEIDEKIMLVEKAYRVKYTY